MAYPTHQQYADLAKDAYENRQVTKYGEKGIPIGGNEYQVLAVANDRFSGYQGTVYRDLKTRSATANPASVPNPRNRIYNQAV
ncbi:hypothetical protein [Neisseria sp. CCUG12390]|uniref:hypothetical protein n=1 Tax=Neisseria sp. CCUG12390 TaxID=3392035 RepID=UPI003A103006